MRRLTCIILVMAVLAGLAGCGGQAAEPSAKEIAFADEVLASAVRAAMGKATGVITAADAEAVTSLDLQMDGGDWSKPRIRSLDGLQYFTNLTMLNLNWAVNAGGQGVDLTPLAGLTRLEALYLCCNDIYDLTPLAKLTGLRELWVWGCRGVSDISALRDMTAMDTLWIKGDMISDVSPLLNLTKLTRLYMEDNAVSDLKPLAGLNSLVELTLSDNPVLDYSPLSDLAGRLTVKDFDPAGGPQAITFRDAVLEARVRQALGKKDGPITAADTKEVDTLPLGNQWQETIPDGIKIRDITDLKYFPRLVKLELMFHGVDSLYVMAALPELRLLDLNGNPIFYLTALAAASSLNGLNLSGGFFSDLTPLAGLTRLESLSLSYSANVKDLSPLAGLTSLKALYIQDINADYAPLAKLTSLTTLYITENSTADLSSLAAIYPRLTDKNFTMK